MNRYPVSRRCPKCGGRASVRRGSAQVCRECSTRYVPPDVADRVLFGLAFLIPGLLFCSVAVFAFVGMATDDRRSFPAACLACPGLAGLAGTVCVVWGIKEIVRRRKRPAPAPDEADAAPAPALPRATAAKMVEWVENISLTGDTLDQLGPVRLGNLGRQIAWFASEWDDDEEPLFFIDTSRREDGTAGILVSDRRLYASTLDDAIPLADITGVSCEEPSENEGFFFLVAVLLFIFCLLVGWIVILYWWRVGRLSRRLSRRRLLVNEQVVYSSPREFNNELWADVLLSLGRAARGQETPAPKKAQPAEEPTAPEAITRHVGLTTESPRGPRRDEPRRLVVTGLETLPHTLEGVALDGELADDPTWEQIERSIRELDRYTHPLVRLWAGQPWQAPGLEIIGGRGKYALHEVGDGWVYYDPNGTDEEVEVQTGGEGYRCAGFYVCTDVGRVLEIARRFCETGAAGDDETS